jgi:hypothetical protein
VVEDPAIYQSWRLGIPKSMDVQYSLGLESGTYCDDVQPFMYRAPEVLLRLSWNER